MSYTNAEQVRHYLVTPYPIQDRINDKPVTISGSGYVVFHGGAVEPSSVKVKSIQSQSPNRVAVTLSSGTAIVAASPLAPGSVVVASDSSLGQVYTENDDYVVDHAAATITAKVGSALAADQAITVWYMPYTLYSEGTDYSLASSRGEIKRLASSAIAEGETVWLDYRPVHLSVADEIVDNAVGLANGLIEREVDPERQFEVDPTLGAAATYRALEIVCRAAASRELASGSGGDKVALAWIKLADDYTARSESLLDSFRPPFDSPRTPVHS
jgi:hypothetical protein